MPNTINLRLLDNKNIIAELNGMPLAQENSYRIIAGEENATIFNIASKPNQYLNAQYTVEMVNSQGYGIKADDIGLVEKSPNEYIIENDTFILPTGMAVAGYGWAQIRAYQGEEKVPFSTLKIKIWNTLPNWKEYIIQDIPSIELDTTLTEEGKAADAKAVGDKLDTKLNSSERSNFVDLTSAQTITGSKTFTAGVIMQNGLWGLGSAAILGAGIQGLVGSPLINVPTSQSGTTAMALAPNTAPTANSIIVNSSTRTPTWKPLSDFVDLSSVQEITGLKKFPNGINTPVIFSMPNFEGDRLVMQFPPDSQLPDDYNRAYFALAPTTAPTEPSFIVTAADRIPTWQSAAPILQDYVDDALLGG